MNELRALRWTGLIMLVMAMLFLQLPGYAQEDGSILPSDEEGTANDTATTQPAAQPTQGTAAATPAAATGNNTAKADPLANLGDFFKQFTSLLTNFLDYFSKFLAAILGGDSGTGGTANGGDTGTTGDNGGTTGDTGTTNTGGDTGDTAGTDTGTTPATGGLQDKIVQAAKNLVNKPFKYDPATNGGRKGCAQVVTTALKAAGAAKRVVLGVLDAIKDLKNAGWKEVKVPPYAKGDVITWKTYDRTGDGVKDADTHIGIIMGSGNNVQAMSNSSSARQPRLNSPNYAPISRVLRKA